jgi:short-subunit dehydrogenase
LTNALFRLPGVGIFTLILAETLSMTSFEKQRVLITGASSGIGYATALAFAKAGAEVILVSRSQERLEQAVQTITAMTGATLKGYSIDLGAVDQVAGAIATLIQDCGPINVLVNNAGMGYTGTLADMPLSDWQQVMDLNLTSVFQCIQAVLPGMVANHQGTIINVASIAARQAFPEWGAYGVSKAALLALSKAVAVETRLQGIRVVTILPGAVNTPLWDSKNVQADFDRSGMLTPECVADTIVQAALLPSGAVIEEITLMPSGGAL